MYLHLNWLKSSFFIKRLRVQNLLFFASIMIDSQYSCCVTPSGIANFVIMIWHMLCRHSLKVVHFCGSILLHGQIIWRMTWLILPMLHSAWKSRAYFLCFVLHSSLVAFPPYHGESYLVGFPQSLFLQLLNVLFFVFNCSCWYNYLTIDAWTNGAGAGARACASFESGVVPGSGSWIGSGGGSGAWAKLEP